jgi:hypothetical protein
VCVRLSRGGTRADGARSECEQALQAQGLECLKGLGGKWPEGCALAALDPSPYDAVLGWPFRNYVALLATLFPGQAVTLLGLRASMGQLNAARCWRVIVQLPEGGLGGDECPRVAGWEATKGEVRTLDTPLHATTMLSC